MKYGIYIKLKLKLEHLSQFPHLIPLQTVTRGTWELELISVRKR
jgi:hypothetical protein